MMRAFILAILLYANPAVADTVFTNVNVIPMTTGVQVLENHRVHIRGDRIYAVGESIEFPKGTTVIDGEGKYLMPGLAEMHGHTPVPDGNPDTPFVRNMMFLYVANGVTTVRGMLGAPGQLELRQRVQEQEFPGPTLYLAGPSFNGNSINSPQQAREKVRQQLAEGWDLLKVHPGLTREEFDAMAETASEVGLRFGGHVPEDVGLEHAIAMGQHTLDHIDGYLRALDYSPEQSNPKIDAARLQSLVATSHAARVWIVPTLVLWDHVVGLGEPDTMRNWPEMKYWPPARVERWHDSLSQRRADADQQAMTAYSQARDRVLKALADGGVGILMGTDSPQIFSVPGFSIHREMAAMRDAGLSIEEILASGTRNVGEYLQGKDAFGVIAPGHRADLILVNGNPLHDLSAIEDRSGVMVRGHWISKDEIQSRLDAIASELN